MSRRSNRIRHPPNPVYIPDLDFLEKEFYNQEDLEEDEKMTEMFQDEEYVPQEYEEDLEEEQIQDQQYIERGLDPKQYHVVNRKRVRAEEEDEEYIPPSEEEDPDETETISSDSESTDEISEIDEDDFSSVDESIGSPTPTL